MVAPVIIRIFLLISVSGLFAAKTLGQHDNDPMAPGSLYEVSGQVRSTDNKTIENVMVRLESASGALVDQGTTDSIGRFRFTRLRSGQYKISATGAGGVAQPQSVDLSRASPRVHVLLQLVPESPTFRSPGTGRAGVVDVRVPAEAKLAFENGREAMTAKKFDLAISDFRKAVEIYPAFYDAHMLLGQLYTDRSEWEKAEASFRQAVKINPRAVMAMVSLGEAYRRQQRYEDGEKILEEALKVDNDSWQVNFTLGRIHWELKDIVKAGRYVARSIELEPDVAEAHLLAGNIFMRAGLPANALIEYEEYLRLAPKGEFSVQTKALVDKLKKTLPAK
jgi:Tfp pilus assembly protein PilF